MRRLAGAALALALAAGACGGGEEPETVRGVVLEVEGGLTSVESFVLRTDRGEVLELVPAPDGDFRFPLPHLHDHRRTLEPVLVEMDRSVDPPLATGIRDADDPGWHTGGDQVAAPTEGAPETTAAAPAEPPPDAAPPGTGDAGETGHKDGDRPPETTPPAEAGGARQPESEEPEIEPEAAGQVIELEIIDGKLEGGARREAVNLGDEVTLRVIGNSRGDVHVHGYDLHLHLEEGAGELAFEASIPGVFEVEMEESHTLLIRLEVS